MKYQEFKDGIKNHLNSAAEDFFFVGYCLRKIQEDELYKQDGYKNIWDFANNEYDLSASTACRFMAINAKFSINDGQDMDQKYIGMGPSKLQEMLSLPDEELEKVTRETTVREIRAMKAAAKEPLSFFGLPKTVRPEDSLITTPGCGDKYDCFLCSQECSIRQEDRRCRFSTCGSPEPCGIIGNTEWKKRIQFSLYKDECQMLHTELAPERAGDGKPEPCCQNCEHTSCFNRCDVAKKKDEDAKKQAEAAERQRLKEIEDQRPEPTHKEIIVMYDWWSVSDTAELKVQNFKEMYRTSGGWNGKFDYKCSNRGIRINHKKELTWAQIIKEFKIIQEERRQAAVEKGKDDKQAYLKSREKEFAIAFYKTLYQSEKEIIKTRKAADVVKTFKKERGETYDGGNNGGYSERITWNCYPDKICFSISGLGAALQIPWGKYVTKLFRILDDNPDLEKPEPEADPEPEEKEPEIIDADFKEIVDEQDPEEKEPAKPEPAADEPDMEEDIDAEEATESQEAVKESERDPEAYTLRDVKDYLTTLIPELKIYKQEGMPDKTIRKRRIWIDALTLLKEKMEAEEAENDD
ncbi:MAG: hypothetical protein PHV18_04475 [Lachnospiraceae bacterium]|nr:hypothetical protein [Lachnospiraceae bacterium]